MSGIRTVGTDSKQQDEATGAIIHLKYNLKNIVLLCQNFQVCLMEKYYLFVVTKVKAQFLLGNTLAWLRSPCSGLPEKWGQTPDGEHCRMPKVLQDSSHA